jgi:predicted RNase H-like HicB family nuclease
VILEKGETGWGAYVPDLPGCVAVAKTLEETERLIEEAITMHIEALRADGDPVPEPTTQSRRVGVA